MNLILDIAFLVLILIFAIVGAKRGIAHTVLELCAFFVSLTLAFSLCTPLATACYDQFLSDRAVQKIEETLNEEAIHIEDYKVSITTIGIPSFIEPFAKEQTEKLKETFEAVQKDSHSKAEFASKLEESVVRPITVKGLSALAFFIVFLVLGVILRILAGFLSTFFRLPLVGAVNSVLGAVFGIVKGLLAVFLIAVLLLFLAQQFGGTLAQLVASSKILEYLQTIFPSLLTF